MVKQEEGAGYILFLDSLVQQSQTVAIDIIDAGATCQQLYCDLVEALAETNKNQFENVQFTV